MIRKTIMDELNEKTDYKGYTLFPFGENAYKDLDDMNISDKKKVELFKIVYAERDLREKAKRTINE